MVPDRTLGGKAKSFKWAVYQDCSVKIQRIFKTKSGRSENNRIIDRVELNLLSAYLDENEWVPLANNVEKLRNGTEKEGIGWFLYNELGWPESDSQLASHLGALFYKAGVWEYNGKKRGMQFRKVDDNWCSLLKRYEQELQHINSIS